MTPANGSAHPSSSDVEQLGDELRLGFDVSAANVSNLPLPDHCHRLITRQCSSSGPEAAKAQPRLDQPFAVTVVLLDDIVQVFHLSQP